MSEAYWNGWQYLSNGFWNIKFELYFNILTDPFSLCFLLIAERTRLARIGCTMVSILLDRNWSFSFKDHCETYLLLPTTSRVVIRIGRLHFVDSREYNRSNRSERIESASRDSCLLWLLLLMRIGVKIQKIQWTIAKNCESRLLVVSSIARGEDLN